MVGLAGFEQAYPYQMSGGMQQRCGLARALAIEPNVLLMDEPFAAVDAQTREILQFELLRIWESRPTTMVFVTHSIEEAVLMGDRVFVLKGRPSSIYEMIDDRPAASADARDIALASLRRAARAASGDADERSAGSRISVGEIGAECARVKSQERTMIARYARGCAASATCSEALSSLLAGHGNFASSKHPAARARRNSSSQRPAFRRSSPSSILYVADKEGFFKKHGVDAEIRPFETGATASRAVISGDIEMSLSPTPLLDQPDLQH